MDEGARENHNALGNNMSSYSHCRCPPSAPYKQETPSSANDVMVNCESDNQSVQAQFGHSIVRSATTIHCDRMNE